MNLFQKPCVDICQRTSPYCRKECHLASGEPALGYETAPAARVHELRLVPTPKTYEIPEDPNLWPFIGLLIVVVLIVTMPFWIQYVETFFMVTVDFVMAVGNAVQALN